MTNQITRSLLLSVCLLVVMPYASALPITINSTDVFRETRFNPPPFFAAGDNFLIDATVSNSSGTTMSVTNSFTSENFGLSFFGSSFGAFIPYSADRAMGDWIFNAVNDSDTATSTLALPVRSLSRTFSLHWRCWRCCWWRRGGRGRNHPIRSRL